MESLADTMRRADEIVDLHDYVRTVKSAVRGSLQGLDSAAHVDDTGYFNHSAIPDFVLTWPGRADRSVYIRRSFEEIRAGQDLQRLAGDRPVLVSAKEQHEDAGAEETLRNELGSSASRGTLIAGSKALDALNETEESANTASPLLPFVASQLLPAGQGVLDEAYAERIVTPTGDIDSDLSRLLDESAYQAVRTISDLMANALDPSSPVADTGKPFSVDEARQLLPWLLRSEGIRDDVAFWRSVGRRLSLKVLEAIHSELEGLDLSNLIPRVWDEWEAKRGYHGVAFEESPRGNRPTAWFMFGKLLTYEFDNGNAFRFSTYGQALKGRGTASSATWDAISSLLDDYQVQEVVLRGIDRSITINANQSPDVRSDTDRIVSSVDDTYYIDALTVRTGALDEERIVRLDFGDSLAYNEGHARILDIVQVLGRLAAYRSPIDKSLLE